ncbi:ribonuclease HI family protein [Patescibacteria group bacterium]|nr:MAG: ribonuclease HI family protein [Patescibacteria group bacterium]
MNHVTIFTDGGSRGNPGPAGSGAVIKGLDGENVASVSAFLGTQTNNFAEYEALVLALTSARDFFGSPVPHKVVVKMDSELIVRQMNGQYKVKHPILKTKHQEVKKLIADSFPDIEFAHVRREENSEADQLANDAMDRGM